VKVTDFGLAKKLDEAGQTHSGAILGTPSYMAPEQAAGKGKLVGLAADTYALGAILYECLTGRPPFKAETAMNTLYLVLTQEPVPVRQLQPTVARDLETVCLKCLRKEPGRRYASALDLAEDLRRFQAGEPIMARPTGRIERAAKWVRRNPAVAALTAAVVLALVAGAVASTLFALDARRQAKVADQRAEDAAREKRRADDSAKEAKEKERLATQALEEVEATLIDSLLRPLGRKSGELEPAEIEALEKLASLSRDRIRLRFLEEGLRRPGTAARLGLRADHVIQAAVGLDAKQRERAERLLVARLQDARAGQEVAEACARLATGLNTQNRALAGAAAQALTAAMAKEESPYALSRLAQALGAVSGRLEAGEASRQAGQAAQALTAALAKTTDLLDLSYLAEGLGAVAGRLEAGPAGKAAQALTAAMAKATNPYQLEYLARGLGAVAGRLEAGQAGQAAEALTAAMATEKDPFQLGFLAQGLGAVAGRLEAGPAARQAGQAAEALTAAMAKTTDPKALYSLAEGLGAVAGRLEAGPAARQAGQAAQALTAALAQETNPDARAGLAQALGSVSGRLEAGQAGQAAQALTAALAQETNPVALSYRTRGLGAVAGRLSTPDIVRALGHPFMVGEARRALLDVLGQRTRRRFVNTWDFLDWAAANGVDPRPAAPAAR
jgi:hypothetical protein